jgi:hypothetical protein
MVGERGTEMRERLRLMVRIMEPRLRLRRRRSMAISPRQNFLTCHELGQGLLGRERVVAGGGRLPVDLGGDSGSWSSGTVRKAGQRESSSRGPMPARRAGRRRGAVDDGDGLVRDRRLGGRHRRRRRLEHLEEERDHHGAPLAAGPLARWSCWSAVRQPVGAPDEWEAQLWHGAAEAGVDGLRDVVGEGHHVGLVDGGGLHHRVVAGDVGRAQVGVDLQLVGDEALGVPDAHQAAVAPRAAEASSRARTTAWQGMTVAKRKSPTGASAWPMGWKRASLRGR